MAKFPHGFELYTCPSGKERAAQAKQREKPKVEVHKTRKGLEELKKSKPSILPINILKAESLQKHLQARYSQRGDEWSKV